MNRIYKVIWSKAKGCYVAVSELAGSHSANPARRTSKKLLSAIILACTLGTAVPAAYAADVVVPDANDKAQVITIKPANASGTELQTNIIIEVNGVGNNGAGPNTVIHTATGQAASDESKNSFASLGFGGMNNYSMGTWTKAGYAMKANTSTYDPNKAVDASNLPYLIEKSDGQTPLNGLGPWEKGNDLGYQINENKTYGYATAFGIRTAAANEGATAFGKHTVASGKYSLAFGEFAFAMDDNATAFGNYTLAKGKEATAFGSKTQAIGIQSTAMGDSSVAKGDSSIAAGSKTIASGYTAVALGNTTTASGSRSVAFGDSTTASGTAATAFGSATKATGNMSTAFGYQSEAQGQLATAFGWGSKAIKSGSTAFGYETKATNNWSTAFGYLSEAQGELATAFGYGSLASGSESTAFGYETKATNTMSTAFGDQSEAQGELATAFGYKTKAIGNESTAFGIASVAKGVNSLAALGGVTETAANNSAAIGKGATVTVADTVALGSGSVANRDATKATAGYDPETKKSSTLKTAVWKANHNAIAVGNGDTVTRQITGVAAGTNDTDVVNVAQLKAIQGVHYYSVNSNTKQGNYNNDGAKSENAIAAGVNAVSDGESSIAIGDTATIRSNGCSLTSMAIGKNAYVLNGIGQQEYQFSLDKGNWTNLSAPKDVSRIAGGIAIGTNSYARTGSVQLGAHTYTGKMGGINVTTDTNKSGNIIDMTTIGTNSYNKGIFGTIVGSYSITTGNFNGNGGENSYLYGSQNFGANIVGSLNSIRSKGYTGDSGIANNIVGIANIAENANGALIFGAGNKISNSIQSIKGLSTGSDTVDATVDSLRKTVQQSNGGGSTLAIGGGNTADYTQQSQLVGVNNTLMGTENEVSSNNLLNGVNNTGTNISHTTIIGTNNAVKDSSSNIILGDNHTLVGNNYKSNASTNNNIIIGSADETMFHQVSGAVSLGHNAKVTVAGGVALGENSVAERKAGKSGYDPLTNAISTEQAVDWIATAGVVSIGDAQHSITRQITGVAAGTDPTDAVNVAQLKRVAQKVDDNETNGLKFSANSGDTVTNKLGSTVTVQGAGTKDDSNYSGDNIKTKVSQDADGNTTIDVMLDNNLSIGGKDGKDGSIGINGADGVSGVGIDGKDGISIKGADGKDGVTIKGVDGTDGTEGHIGLTGPKGTDGTNATADIHVKPGDPGVNGADGTTMTRVVYEDQDSTPHQVATLDDGMKYMGDSGTTAKVKLNKIVNIVGGVKNENLLSDNNIGVVSSQDGDNGKLTVKLAKDLSGLNSITFGDATVVNPVSIGSTGLSNGGNKITNVADGDVSATSTDAVNGSQLSKSAAAATTTLEDGTNTTVSYRANADGSKTYKVDVDANSTFGTGDTAINVNGETGKIKAGTGDNAVTIDGTKGTVTAGKVTINGTAGTVNGLTNTTWDSEHYVSGQGATEDQLKAVSDKADKAAQLGKQHATVTVNNGSADGNLVMNTSTNSNDGTNYDISLSDNINVGGTTSNGSIGVNGSDGTNGVTISAKDGKDGHIGINGKDGSSADITVHDGVAGVNGKDGETQTRITYADKNGTSHDAATLDDGMKYSGDTGSAAVTLNKNVSVVGETTEGKNLTTGNIGVEAAQDGDNAKLVVKLADNLTGLKSITTENVNTTTIKVGDTVTINKDGIDAGNKKITNVANGQISSGSSDAVNGSQLYAVQQNVTNINNDLTNLDNRVSNMDDRINKVGAGAAALASLHPLDFDPDDKWDFAAGYGNYRNANAAAVGAFYRPNEDTMLSIGGSFGNGENMLNAGISFKLGQGNHVSTSKVAMAKEIKDMRKEMEAMKSAILDQNAGRKLDTSKLQLFPDVPENHWAYEDVAVLAGNGIIKGYPDGTFDGNRPMTRYEFASMLYKAMLNGAKLSDKMLNEFAPELERFTVDAVHTDKNGNATVERVRVVKEQTNK